MTNIIGNKSTFAVEYSLENKEKLIGRAKLWINGISLGSLDDTIFFDGYLIGGLTEILNKNKLDERYLLDDHHLIYDLLEKDMNLFDDEKYDLAKSFSVNLGTWSDYFDVYSYKLTDNIGIILWKFIGHNDALEDLIGYPRCVFYEQFRYDELVNIINKLHIVGS
ncbi:hypothetical protein CE143_01535 [Photorhabdus luminescens]|uniref:Uncharacterized protein n=1 Tax=Photorhabdus akhurstii TaxID=171438 RepID=A0ABX8LS74_9GAMM|nr:hypothetical protein [Photorhabdus akhurstii]QXF32003.1 hypothetical protein B0X70_01540 [Photorhabdus akhurstii]UJD73795.1 hypothetical protein CE143_01535 [Photorhabdus luminescens]